MKEVAVSEARETLAELIEQTQHTGEPVAVTRRGKRVAVMMDPAEYERLTSKFEDVLDAALLRMAREEDDYVPWEEAKRLLGLS